MSIWPFTLGRFIELPYTLVQDYTLVILLGEKTARMWLQKLEFIAKHYGIALVNTHPDYLKDPEVRKVYIEFLQIASKHQDYWHALPRDVACWWSKRAQTKCIADLDGATQSRAIWDGNELIIEPLRCELSAEVQ